MLKHPRSTSFLISGKPSIDRFADPSTQRANIFHALPQVCLMKLKYDHVPSITEENSIPGDGTFTSVLPIVNQANGT